eukprot:13761454-Heterocapsa_arctica.AAC.1
MTNYFTFVGERNSNMTQGGLDATERLRSVGMPSSYLEPMEPGGHLWELGADVDPERPGSYSR